MKEVLQEFCNDIFFGEKEPSVTVEPAVES